MNDWVEYFVIVGLAALIMVSPMLYVGVGYTPPQLALLPFAWAGVMYMVWDWDI